MEKIDLVNALKTALNDETVAREVIGAAVKTIINGKEAPSSTESGWLSLLFNPTTNDMKLRSDQNTASASEAQGIALTTGTNVDDIKTPGTYNCSNATVSSSLTGERPGLAASNGFCLKVGTVGASTRPYQLIFVNHSEAPVYYRVFVSSGWTAWKKLSTEEV